MDKKIAKIIKKIVDESPYDHFTCEVIPNEESDGFWKTKISFSRRDDAHSESLVRLLKNLGRVYGEDVFVEDKGKIVEVS